MIQLKRIMVATDFSEYSEHAIRYAAEFARQFGASMLVVHVLEEDLLNVMPSIAGFMEPEALDLGRYRDEFRRATLAAIERTVEGYRAEQIDVDSLVVEGGRPSTEIVRVARERSIDLLFLSTHGRGGLRHALIGSTAEKVVRKSSCPVLTVKAAGHHFIAPRDPASR